MAKAISECMTSDPKCVEADAPIVEAARVMHKNDVGDVLVTEDGKLAGLVTDRDIVVRAVAEGRDPESTAVSEVCTSDVHTLSPDDSVEDAVALIREHDVRRVPVVEDGKPVGIITMGDLARDLDPKSALADVSSAEPNN